MGETITFWVLAVVSVGAALGMVFNRKAVYSALMLGAVMLCLAVLYAVQDAPFLAAVQIIVYTGAIMMLFLFVLMLVGRDSSDSVVEVLRGQRLWAAVLGVGLAGLVVGALAGPSPRSCRSAWTRRRPTAGGATSTTSAGCCSPTTCSRSSSPRPC
jgi:NADH-quinone oxidoreductase subunit J